MEMDTATWFGCGLFEMEPTTTASTESITYVDGTNKDKEPYDYEGCQNDFL
jgi:hypothetical protein